MLFNSLQFAVFFAVVYGLYLALNHRWQNRMLLVASYIFYGAWDWRYLSLILISTWLDYYCAIKIRESAGRARKRRFLILSIAGSLGILGCFKYYNFFAASLQALLGAFGIAIPSLYLSIILPVGISFYTFQTMSYTIDVYRGEMEPTRSFLDFALFVAYFPQLVAGPIERAKHLLPQVLSPRTVTREKVFDGCYLILWGLFQKIFVADNLARLVDPVFAAPGPYNGAQVLLALYAFAVQIYCDFAGYSSIARGLGKCMGFEIMVNFNLPYASTNPREFWQRWHISLSTWLKDYLYIPLGGNRRGTLLTYRNLAITMLLGGLWHGAAWNFVLWGAYWGTMLILHRLLRPLLEKIPSPPSRALAASWKIVRIAVFFHLACLSWLLFRARSLDQILRMLHGMVFNFSFLTYFEWRPDVLLLAIYILFLLAVEIVQYLRDDPEVIRSWPAPARIAACLVLVYSILILGVNKPNYFIYFQF